MKKITITPLFYLSLLFILCFAVPLSAANSPEKQVFTFTNSTGVAVNDLHLELTNGVLPQNLVTDNIGISKVGGVFAQYPTSGSPTNHDYAQGTVPIGGSVTIQFDGSTKVKEWYWTVDGVREGAVQGGTAIDLSYIAYTPIPREGAVVELPAYISAGSIELENATGEMVFGITATVWHPDPTGNVNIIAQKVLHVDEIMGWVDDNYDGQWADNENDYQNDPQKPFSRSFFQQRLRKNRTLEYFFEFDQLTQPGTLISFQFNKQQASVYFDIVSTVLAGEPGQTAFINIPFAHQNGSFQIRNESMNYLSMVIIPPSEVILENMAIEAPFNYSFIENQGEETFIFFDPPIPPFDYATVNYQLPQANFFPGAMLQFITLESYPQECELILQSYHIADCVDVNYYDLELQAALLEKGKYCREYSFTNSLDQAASDLHVTFRGTGGSLETTLIDNPPGCPIPTIPSNGTVTNTMEMIWPSACVDKGETVKVKVCTNNGPLVPDGGFWTLNDEPIGDLRQEDIGEGEEGGRASKGIGVSLDGITQGVLHLEEDNTAKGIFSFPANGEPQELVLELISDYDCLTSTSIVLESPICNNQINLAPCEMISDNGLDIPVDWYPWEHKLPGQAVIKRTPDNPIASLRVIPPQMLDPDDAYTCEEDYWVDLVPGDFPAHTAVFHFKRAGHYFIEIIYADGTIERKICIVDERCIEGIGQDGSCYGGVFREIPCGEPDLAVVSSTLGFPHSWGDTGVVVDNIKGAIKAICAAAEEKGGPVSINITGHGAPGYVIIGTERLDIESAKELIKELKDKNKVSDITIFACSAARGEKGNAFICKLEQELGVEVTGYTGVVSSLLGPPERWFTVGEAYSWEDATSSVEHTDVLINDLSVSVYPNPVKDQLLFDITTTATEVEWQFFNADGRELASSVLLPIRKHKTIALDTNTYPTGAYFLRITNGKEVVVKKVIKVNR